MLPFEVEGKVRCRNQVWEVIKITDNQDRSWTVRLLPENGGKPGMDHFSPQRGLN